MSQRDLAARAGVSRMTIQRAERGQVMPTGATVTALALALGCHPLDLAPHPDPHDRLAS